MTVIPIVIYALDTVTKRLVKGFGGLRNKRTSGDHPSYSIIKIDQNTEKSSGDLRRLAVAQTPVEDDQLTLVWKTLKEVDASIQQHEDYIQKLGKGLITATRNNAVNTKTNRTTITRKQK